jgi:hypothetical protein
MHELAQEFMDLFTGHDKVHGVYTIGQDAKAGSNGKIVGRAATVSKPLTLGQWDLHLRGVQGLGVVPIMADQSCLFGAIDVDVYPIDMKVLAKKLFDEKLPLIPCKTKSGGAHLYLFLSERTEARVLINKLREFASVLGYGECEIYPRQSQVIESRGDMGNWINMPYFRASETDRYALGDALNPLTPELFLQVAKSRKITRDQLVNWRVVVPDLLPGGPPCLQRLISQGFPQGTRNNGLFNLGVYFMKAHPEGWEKHVEEANQKHMTPPLSSEETLAVIRSVRKKEYTYTCKAQPIQSFCDSAKCRLCAHGIGGGDIGMPRMGSLSKLNTSPAIWFIDVETDDGGRRLELTTEDLQSPLRFQTRCMESLNMMPQLIKREQWHSIVSKMMEGVTVLDVPAEMRPAGNLYVYLEEFCTSRVQAKTADEIMLGKPYCHNGEINFRMTDFMRYLDRVRYRDLSMSQVAMHIRDIAGSRRGFMRIRGRGVTTFCIPENTFIRQTEKFETPAQPHPPI